MNDIEQQFFKVFGIEKECVRGCGEYYLENGNFDAWNEYDCKNSDCSKCEHDKSIWKYPKITDRKLLEIICILSQSYPLNYEGWSFNTVQDLKETILEDCIETAKRLSLSSVFANKIQQLFKEEE